MLLSKQFSATVVVACGLAVGALTACSSLDVSTSGAQKSGSVSNAGGKTTNADSTGDSTGDSTSGSATDNSLPPGELDWGTCTDEKATDPSLQCATLTVPLDYSNPAGDTIDLALVRVPATGKRTGAVLFNPGGPGGSGFDYIAQGGPTISGTLGLTDLDLIGFDPRGVDRSNGIRCLSDAEEDKYAYIDDTPDTPEAEAKSKEAETAFSTACTAKYGDTLQFYSTDNTARDMDAIRAALGDDTISYLGISYGTYLGAVYATMFPDHVRALVLDSAFEPSGDTLDQQYETQLVGFEGAFDQWAGWCQTNDACEFKTADVGAAWDALRAQLDASPVTNADGRIGNQVVMVSATIAALYSKAEWPVLGAALADVAKGDASGIFRLADSYSGRDADGHYSTIDQSNQVITCASGLASEVPPDPAAYAEHLRSVAPRFGSTYDADSFDEKQQCEALMPDQPADKLSYSGKAPIVVIGGTNDPATPIRWAQEMTADLGPSATMVTYTGEGHGQLLASKCVTAIEAALLADLKSPPPDTTCEPDPDVERPAWWDLLPAPTGIDPVLDSPELAGALGISTTDVYSEMHTSDLSPADVLAAYKPELSDAGFEFVTEREPLDGSDQALYKAPGGDLFSVFVLGPDAFKTPDLESAADLVPAGKSIVFLLYIPQ